VELPYDQIALDGTGSSRELGQEMTDRAQAQALEADLRWLDTVISAAMKLYFGQPCEVRSVRELPPPVLPEQSTYARVLEEWGLNAYERLIVLLALAPHVRPQVLDPFLIRNTNLDLPFAEFGGVGGGNHRGFWPTAETAAFVLAGENLFERIETYRLFDADGTLRGRGILQWDDGRPGEGAGLRAYLGQPLQLSPECRSLLTSGAHYRPSYGGDFPAQRIETPLEWSDLILPAYLRDEVEEIRAWIQHHPVLLHEWGLSRHVKPGFRSLFHGPPGTGKTLTASLLGKSTGLDVYRVDLSLVVSKYIGETEKNLARVFDQAQRQNWILFFDEADALFGKRSGGSSANDRYANQEVAYLLQRVEDFPGVVILATNLKANIDEAFARRFQSVLYFPMPAVQERLRLWQGAFAPPCRLDANCSFARLAEEFELSGGSIINVLRYAALLAVRRGEPEIRLDDIRQGVRREFRKEGRVSV
jgi:hypothetical protein